MKASKLFLPTLRQAPQDADMRSHQLLLRGGFIRKLTSGVYTFLPLGWKVVRKIEAITREEMDRVGGQELLLPALQPKEIWERSGRWDETGGALSKLKLKDHEDREFCLGPTHEEVITLLAAAEVHSYRQLPLLLYQIQTKFRDELRPRGGLLRGKEFIMKDLYSFHATKEDLDVVFDQVFTAYCNILDRCGLSYRACQAEGGAIGGSETNEFMVPSEAGEDTLVECPVCGYAENGDSARRGAPKQEKTYEPLPLEEVLTPGSTTIEQVSRFLHVRPERLVKTIIYRAGDQYVAGLVRGDKAIHEPKLMHFLGVSQVEMADGEAIERLTGAPAGFSGPVGLKDVRLIADRDIAVMCNFVVGANKKDAHLINVNLGRDFQVEAFADLRKAEAGDPCPKCGDGVLTTRNSIEAGHIFKLGTKYSASLGALFMDEDGEQKPIIMGCYGLGITRLLSCVAETLSDDRGMRWPAEIAPFEVVVLQLDTSSPCQNEVAGGLYRRLQDAGVDVLYDERDERPGVKFRDAELVGIPFQVIVGKVTEAEGKVEVAERGVEGKQALEPDQAFDWVLEKLRCSTTSRP